MAGYRMRAATAATVAALAALLGLSGCSDNNTPSSSAASKAASAASAASSLASKAGESAASASAEARRRLDEVKNGVNAKGEVALGTPGTGSGGHATVEVTAHNTARSTKSFAVQVDFTDASGNLLDATVVTVKDVPAGGKAKATASSTRKLSGEVKTDVARALRY
ncbi:FxLYD domain-containing protein [Streptomyces sp. NPDC046805]|uniref:FxLYD domain-containing protein n=1 Tax=Streptomyces sp. NPDC046805 TaxID=3155134 RepID=UPI003400AA23